MKQKHLIIFAFLMCLFFFEGRGQYVFGETEVDLAEDNASNYSPPTWDNNSNQGDGFSNWAFDTGTPNGGFAGNFIGDFSSEINTNGKVFALFANSGNDAFSGASRQFPKAMHRTDQFSVKVAMNFRDGAKGFDLRDSNNNSILNFNVANNQYRLNGTIILFEDIYDANTVFEFTFTQNENSLDWTIIRTGGLSGTQSGTIAGINSGTINNIRFYNVSDGTNDDGGGARNLFFNDLNFISKYTIPSSENISLNETDTSESAPYVWVQSNASLNFGSNLLQIENTGLVNNLGTLTDLSGTLEFLGAGSISGTVNLHNLEINGGVNAGSSTTVANECVIKSGSFFSDNAPRFLVNSSLVYDTGGNYNRGIEWNNSTTTNQGTPHNVEVRSGSFQMNETGFTSGTATILGDLLITGGSFNMNGFTHSDVEANNIIVNGGAIEIGDTSFDGGNSGRSLVANGDFRNLVGSVTLGDEFQGDLKVRGTELIYLTEDSSFNSQGRAVIFEGDNIINVTSTGEIVIDFVVINMSGGKVIVDNNLTIQGLSGTGGESGILLQMQDQATLDLNGFDLFLGGSIGSETFDVVMEGDTKIISTPTTIITILNDGDTQLRLDESQQGVTNAVRKLIVNNEGKTIISNDLHIFESLDVDEAEVDGNDKLIFRSSEQQTAVITEVKNGGSVTGTIRTERFFKMGNRAFRYVSPSVTSTATINAQWQEGINNTGTDYPDDNELFEPGFGTHITGSSTGANGFDATETGNPSLFTWNVGSQTWASVSNTDATTLNAGEPLSIMIRGDRSADLSNNNSTGASTILRSAGTPIFGDTSYNSNVPVGEFVLIGNPYQAQVDLTQVDTSGFTDDFYIWDASMGTFGGYALFDGTSTTPDSGTDVNQFLQVNQAFFKRASATSQSITFSETYKHDGINNNTTFSSPEFTRINVNLLRNGNLVVDGLRIDFDESYEDEVNLQDATKLWNLQEYFAIDKNPNWLMVEKRTIPENESIQLYLDNYFSSEYTLSLNVQNLNTHKVFLYDAYLDESTELASNQVNTYAFEVDSNIQATQGPHRFSLHFEQISLDVQDLDVSDFVVYPNPTSGEVTIQLPRNFSGENLQIKLTDLLGKTVFTQEFNITNQQIELQLPDQLKSGIYLIQLSTEDSSFVQKLIKK